MIRSASTCMAMGLMKPAAALSDAKISEVRASFALQGLMRTIGAELTELGAGRCTIMLPFSAAVGQFPAPRGWRMSHCRGPGPEGRAQRLRHTGRHLRRTCGKAHPLRRAAAEHDPSAEFGADRVTIDSAATVLYQRRLASPPMVPPPRFRLFC